MKIHSLVSFVIEEILPAYNGDSNEARAVALRLLAYHLQCKPHEVFIMRDAEIRLDFETLKRDVAELKKGVPIQYITQEQEFAGLTLYVKPGVLIPRPETEELVNLIIKDKPAFDVAIDIGTGSGCIALTIKKNFPPKRVIAIDNDPISVEVTQTNATNHRLDIEILLQDIFSWEPTKTLNPEDKILIASNPPYVLLSEKSIMSPQVLLHEPEHAIFVPEEDPIIFYRTIIEKFCSFNTTFYFEINPLLKNKLKWYLNTKNKRCEFYEDFRGKVRFLKVFS